jgi:exopolysaccharide biosynthesis WecB/TagA/CpsF family protein
MTILDPRMNAVAIVDGQAINVRDPDDAIARVRTRLRAGRGFTFATLNLDHLVKLRTNAAFRAAYARMTLISADGAPVAALARDQAANMRRATGADLMRPLCEMAARENIPVAFFGSREETLKEAAIKLRSEFPALKVVFIASPPQGFDPLSTEAAAWGDRIAASGARLVFVSLGAPKQEVFADLIARKHATIGFIGVGAAVDFIAGAVCRAPRLMRALGMEWAWRAACEPRRLGWRYMQCAALLGRIMIERRLLQARPAFSAQVHAAGE